MKNYILLTGAAGFLGSRILKSLILKKYNVIILLKNTTKTTRINKVIKKCKVIYLRNIKYDQVFKNYQIDIIINTAVQYNRKNESIKKVYDGNFNFPLKLLQYAIKYDVKYFINSDTFYSKYRDNYSLSKKHFVDLLYFFRKKIKIINLRLAHSYGENDNDIKFLPWLLRQVKMKNNIIKIRNPYEYRDFIHVDDVSNCFIKIIQNIDIFKKNFYLINVDTKKYYSLKYFINQITNYYKNLNKNNTSKIIFAKKPSRIFKKKSINSKDDKILQKIGWKHKFNLKDGIHKTLENTKW